MKYTLEQALCYHCGNECNGSSVFYDEKDFCCQGCKSVYSILRENSLCSYYTFEDKAGVKIAENIENSRFDFLDTPQIADKLLDFSDGTTTANINFFIPSIHCSSCIWLLEHLYKLDKGVTQSRVDFLKKTVFVSYNPSLISLKSLVVLLASIGYEPLISHQDVVKSNVAKPHGDLLLKIAVAGFCSGNIMMFSFPEYFGLDAFSMHFKSLFTYINLFLSLPVLFYSGSVYFSSVYSSLKSKYLNIDAPILLGILATFVRSLYEVFSGTGVGYFDSMSGLIFFLLMGRWVQQRGYSFLSFERDYKSYFPLSTTVLIHDKEVLTPIESLKQGDKIIVKNNELIPADALLYDGKACIDYSFVSGEATPVAKKAGDLLYAGGRQVGGAIEMEIVKDVSQSYLTQLWNNSTFAKTPKIFGHKSFADAVAKYFTFAIIFIALSASVFWFFIDSSKVLHVLTAVLIVACPCTLALSYPMALGNVLQQFGKNKFYLKNSEVVEKLSQCDVIVFDKTGTITDVDKAGVKYYGKELTHDIKLLIFSTAKQMTHPLSKAISQTLQMGEPLQPDTIQEYQGEGAVAQFSNTKVRIGSKKFLLADQSSSKPQGSEVYVEVNGLYYGHFTIKPHYIEFLPELLYSLKSTHTCYLLSGDNNSEAENLKAFFGENRKMFFNQSPQQKMDFVAHLQREGKKVCMIGDGLNDAGALKEAHLGIAITRFSTMFTPACDAILEHSELRFLPQFIATARNSMNVIRFSFAVSLIYNLVGLAFALTGQLQPVVAALLMPLNSLSVVGIAFLGTKFRHNS